jgi:uncharacterized protein YcbX
MLGERLERTLIGTGGLPGDRAWATRDEVRGGIRGAKKIPGLMQVAAAYAGGDVGSPPTLTFPDGVRTTADDPEASAVLSRFLDHEVTLWPLQPEDDLDHYRRGPPDGGDPWADLQAMFGLEGDDPLPDMSAIPPLLLQFESPPGTYFDAFPIMLLSTSTLRAIQAAAPDSVVDVRRFRPNLVLDIAGEGAPENQWRGRRVGVGDDVVLRIEGPCPRCVMTTHGFADVPQDRRLLKTLTRAFGQSIGVYASVEEPGTVAVGAPVALLDD